jgi:hypothetical protein
LNADFQFRPRNYKELYNLRHSQARNVVERIFGVVKRRFRLMVAAPEYSLETQTKIVPALCMLHNFIWVYDSEENVVLEELSTRAPRRNPEDFSRQGVSAQEKARANTKRDDIAKEMWREYQEYLNNP